MKKKRRSLFSVLLLHPETTNNMSNNLIFGVMKTKQNLVNTMFTNILTAGLFTFAFTACSDDIEYEVKNNDKAQIEIPAGGLDLLEQHSYVTPYKVEARGDWKIDFTFNEGNQICYALPNHGHGPTEVKICVLDNWTDERRTGEMTITDMDAKKEVKLKVGQKCNLDNALMTRANGTYIIPNKGNRIYGVGYGYNQYLPLSQAIGMSPIIKLEEVKDSHIFSIDGVQMTESFMEATGSTFQEMSNDFQSKATANGKGFGFKGEASAAYNRKDFSQNKHEYALCRVDVTKTKAQITTHDLTAIIANYMCDDAYYSINGLPAPVPGARIGRDVGNLVAYPSTDQGFYNLIKAYGTHLILSADMGGRVTYANTIDVSKVQGSYDINAFAKCSYSNSFMEANSEVKDEYKKSFETNKSAVNTIVTTYGGTQESGTKVSSGAKGSIAEWKKALDKVENCKVVNVDQMIPLWDLVNTSKPEGQERQRLLKEFIETKLYNMMQSEQAQESYATGTIAHLSSIPSFAKAEETKDDATLIKDVYMSGMHVARICHEYIPIINKVERITVIYPVIENNVKYNLGYWIGDANRKPCRVCCTDDNITVQEIANETKGAKTDLYLRGSSFYTKEKNAAVLESSNTADTKIEDTYLRAAATKDNRGEEVSHKYPIVKIFSRIWTRENFTGITSNAKAPFGKQHGLYSVDCDLNFNVNNWKGASKEDFQNLTTNFQKAGVTTPSTVLHNDSQTEAKDLTGFNLKWVGYEDGEHHPWVKTNETFFVTKDKNGAGWLIGIHKSDGISMDNNFYKADSYSVRLCCPVSMQK